MSQEKRAATLYLHIGTPKTGTTAIQKFCYANIAALTRRGYCFPVNTYGIAPYHNGTFLAQLRQAEDGSFRSARDEDAWRERMDYLSNLMRRHERVILSEEIIWSRAIDLCPGLWRNLKAEAERVGFSVKVIVYLRSQDQFIASHWMQRVKDAKSQHGQWTLEEAFTHTDQMSYPYYYEALERIAAFFGRESVVPRIYDRNCFPGGNIISDFLAAIGTSMDGGDFVQAEEEVNPSIGGSALEIKRIINGLPGFGPSMQEKSLEAAFTCYAAERERAEYSLLSPEERDAIMARYAETNRLLARDYFGDESLQLFPAPEAQPPKWTPDNPGMYEAIIRFMGMMLLQQQREINALRIDRRIAAFFKRARRGVQRRLRTALWQLKKRLPGAR